MSRFVVVLMLLAAACASAPLRPPQQDLAREIEAMLLQAQQRERLQSQRRLDRRVEPQRFSEETNHLLIPVSGVSIDQLRSTFGEPRSSGRTHMGIDIFAERGTPIVAAAAGTIKLLDHRDLSGRCIWIETGSGDLYFYAHLDRWQPGLYEGQRVEAGDVLGYVGNTGNATSPHLHFETHRNGVAVDPYSLLAHQ